MQPTEQIEFSQSVEGLFIKGLGKMLTPELRSSLRAFGLDLDRPLLPGYPAADFHRCVETVARGLYPGLDRDEALRRIGHRAVSGLEEGVVGRALAAGLRLIGPRRSLQRVERIFKNNNNYQEARLLDLSESEAHVQLSFVFGMPTYYQGLFEASVSAIGARDARVEIVPTPPPGVRLRITWST